MGVASSVEAFAGSRPLDGSRGGLALGIDTARILRWYTIAIGVALGLGALRFGVEVALGRPYNELAPFLSVDREASLPTWVSVMLLGAIGGFMHLAASAARAGGEGTARSWKVLGWIFIYMAADELVAIHEGFDRLGASLVPGGGLFHFGWVVFGLIAVAAAGLGFLPFLFRLRRITAIRLFVAGAVYVFGALGLEMLGGLVIEATEGSFWRGVMAMFEETFEMVGLALALRAVLLHLAATQAQFRVEAATG